MNLPRRSLLLSLMLASLAAASLAAQDGPTSYPSADADWPGRGAIRRFGWMDDNRKAFWQQRLRDQGAIVFAGDSLIAGWQTLGRDFPGLRTANRGIGGDVTRGLLFRFQEDMLDLRPTAVVLLIGTNDLSTFQATSVTVQNIDDMLRMAHDTQPRLPIVLCTIPLRQNAQAPIAPGQPAELNNALRALAQKYVSVQLFDLHAVLSGPGGGFAAENFAPDRMHPSKAGYEAWRLALTPVLTQWATR